jgi:predicted DNA-binding transcriptional regulator AlpA
MTQTITLPAEGFVKLDQVLQVIPVSRSTWFRGIQAGRYPPPVKLSERSSAWLVDDIRECIARISRGSPPAAIHQESQQPISEG